MKVLGKQKYDFNSRRMKQQGKCNDDIVISPDVFDSHSNSTRLSNVNFKLHIHHDNPFLFFAYKIFASITVISLFLYDFLYLVPKMTLIDI